jgi:hypothetical protein
MRTLILVAPNMSGADVVAWQHFLATKGVYTGLPDGVYGSTVMQSSKSY